MIISVRRIWGAVRVSCINQAMREYDVVTTPLLHITDMPCKRQGEHTRQCSCLFGREFVRVSQERHVERKNRTWLILVRRADSFFFFFHVTVTATPPKIFARIMSITKIYNTAKVMRHGNDHPSAEPSAWFHGGHVFCYSLVRGADTEKRGVACTCT